MDQLKHKILNSCDKLNKAGLFKNTLDYEKCRESVEKSAKKDTEFYDKLYTKKVNKFDDTELLDYNKFLKEFCINYNKLSCETPELCKHIDLDYEADEDNEHVCIPDNSKIIKDNFKGLKKLLKKKINDEKTQIDFSLEKNNVYKDLVFKYKNFLDIQEEISNQSNNNLLIEKKNVNIENKLINNGSKMRFYAGGIVILSIINIYIYTFLLRK
tara:strand:- start:347 stop:985 length:639 start_codon:yes stop_codon:yes gene_type:complete